MAGQSKIYKKVLSNADIYPFMEVLLEDGDILGVESIIVKEGTTIVDDPAIEEFYVDEEEYVDKRDYTSGDDTSGKKVNRFFEVENLLEPYRYGYAVQKGEKYYNPVWEVADLTYVEVGKAQKSDYSTTPFNYIYVITTAQYNALSDAEKKKFSPYKYKDSMNAEIDYYYYDTLTPEEQSNYSVSKYFTISETKVNNNYEPYQYINQNFPNDLITAEEYDNMEEGDERPILESVPTRYVVRGYWKRFKNKFITEYTNNWALRIIFGKGLKNEYGQIPEDAHEFTKHLMCRMQANDYMGVLPEADSTMYVLYRVGGGEQSNIAKDTLKHIIYQNTTIEGNCEDYYDATKKKRVLDSLTVTNTTPSYGGKDEPSFEELRYIIKYNNASQNRCVTLHDYYARIMEIPAKYGCPFRCGIVEENNKVMVYMLGIDQNGRLRSELAEPVAENIKNYLSNYRMINDLVEMRSGKIINLYFEVDIFVDKSYDKGEVAKRVIDTVYDYMDVRKHKMGEDVFIGDLEKEISKLDGVQNLIELRVYNKVGSYDGYSDNEITQELVSYDDCDKIIDDDRGDLLERRIDLKKSDKILFTESNSMFEIKYKEKDIKINVKQRT